MARSKTAAVALYERNGYFLALDSHRGLVLPGGSVEEGESPCEGAAREFQEETGAVVLCMGPELLRTQMGPRTVHVFEVLSAAGSLRASEEGTPTWVREQDLLASVYGSTAQKALLAYRRRKKER